MDHHPTARTPAPVEPLERAEYDAAALMRDHPPRIDDPNKRIVFEVACPGGAGPRGRVGFSRWPALPLPPIIEPAAGVGIVDVRDGNFDYRPVRPGAVEWHLNFADPSLFAYYGTGLLAQDELQVAEHPILAALVEALRAEGRGDRTVEPDGTPTPVLVTGAERRVHLQTNPDPAAGRPAGLYGGRFRAAPPEVVRRATVRLDPPTRTNILAIAAPAYGVGRYRPEEIERILVTAHAGFRAAVLESGRLAASVRTEGRAGSGSPSGATGRPPVVVHTGYWGCGAFGGNRELMALLQIAAAGLAGLDSLVFHTGSGGRAPVEAAIQRLRGLASMSTPAFMATVAEIGYVWGVGNGT